MKICPKCGAENKENSKFCIKCGTSLDQSSVPYTREEAKKVQVQQKQSDSGKNPKKKSSRWLIVILIVIILVLLFIIGCALGKSPNSSSSSSSTKKTPVKQSSVLTQQQKQAAQSKQQNNTNNQNNLSVKGLTPQQTATAIAYYEQKNGVQSGLAWDSLQGNAQRTVTLNNDDSENIPNKGAGVSYSFDTQSGGGCEYVLTDNGQSVTFYVLSADLTDPDSGVQVQSSDSPSLQTIVNYINQQNAAQTVRNVAQGVKIVDNRKQKLDTKNLTKQQLKDWAIQTFKNTYSDSANDDLSAEYLGLDSDSDAEVIVHDHDNSDMDTTYRVNSDGALQEQDGSDWTTVSTSFNE